MRMNRAERRNVERNLPKYGDWQSDRNKSTTNPAVFVFIIVIETDRQTASSFRTPHMTAHDVTSRNTAHFTLTVVGNSKFRDRKAAQNCWRRNTLSYNPPSEAL